MSGKGEGFRQLTSKMTFPGSLPDFHVSEPRVTFSEHVSGCAASPLLSWGFQEMGLNQLHLFLWPPQPSLEQCAYKGLRSS